jgi:hypothetical protein
MKVMKSFIILDVLKDLAKFDHDGVYRAGYYYPIFNYVKFLEIKPEISKAERFYGNKFLMLYVEKIQQCHKITKLNDLSSLNKVEKETKQLLIRPTRTAPFEYLKIRSDLLKSYFSNLTNLRIFESEHLRFLSKFVLPLSCKKLQRLYLFCSPFDEFEFETETDDVKQIFDNSCASATKAPTFLCLRYINICSSLAEEFIIPYNVAINLLEIKLVAFSECKKIVIPPTCTKIEKIYLFAKELSGFIIPPSPNLKEIILHSYDKKIENVVFPKECKNVEMIKIIANKKISSVVIPPTYTKLKTLICMTYEMDMLKIPKSCKSLEVLLHPQYITKFQVHSNVLKAVEEFRMNEENKKKHNCRNSCCFL